MGVGGHCGLVILIQAIYAKPAMGEECLSLQSRHGVGPPRLEAFHRWSRHVYKRRGLRIETIGGTGEGVSWVIIAEAVVEGKAAAGGLSSFSQERENQPWSSGHQHPLLGCLSGAGGPMRAKSRVSASSRES
ncbi:hypothetical protein ACLOJK_023158 [Asimina triloba]